MATAVGRLRGRRAFEELRASGVRRRSGPLAITWAPANDGVAAVGFAIGRNVGPAVTRNRLRRRLRAALAQRAATSDVAPGSYLVTARPEARNLPFSEITRHVATILDGFDRAR